jgi:lipopolysaccharide assembly protein A
MQKLHQYTVIFLTVLALIFILQNMQNVSVNVFFWQLNMPRALFIGLVLIIGILIGILLRNSQVKNKGSE